MNSNDDLIGPQLRLPIGSATAIRGCSAGVRVGFDDVAFKKRIPSKVYFYHAVFATEPSVGVVSGCGVLIHECWLN